VSRSAAVAPIVDHPVTAHHGLTSGNNLRQATPAVPRWRIPAGQPGLQLQFGQAAPDLLIPAVAVTGAGLVPPVQSPDGLILRTVPFRGP
jgi:hypothetical protein